MPSCDPKTEFLDFVRSLYNPALACIDHEACKTLQPKPAGSLACAEELPAFCAGPADAIRFCLAFNALNHRYWTLGKSGVSRWRCDELAGAHAAFRCARDLFSKADGFDDLREKLCAEPELFGCCFPGIPDPDPRAAAVLQTLGPNGAFCAEMILQCALEEAAFDIELAKSVANLLPLGFKDPFLKKAMLALHMCSGYLQMHRIRVKTRLCAFADYQIPKTLRALGCIRYAPELASKVDSLVPLPEDSPEENAIRAAAVLACEAISSASGVDPAELDFWLWSRRNSAPGDFHLTFTARY